MLNCFDSKECISCVVSSAEKKGNSAFSSRIIFGGEVILSNEAFCHNVRQDYIGKVCNFCMLYQQPSSSSLLACSSCKIVRYCTKECQKLDWPCHKAVCKETSKQLINKLLTGSSLDDARLLLRLFSKLKSSTTSKSKQSQSCGRTCCAASHFNGLGSGGGVFSEETIKVIGTVCELMGGVSEAQVSDNIKFVATTYTQHQSNSFGITDSILTCLGMGVFPSAALLNHSCAPNCALRFVLRQGYAPVLQVMIALRPIQIHEELCHSYTDCSVPTSAFLRF